MTKTDLYTAEMSSLVRWLLYIAGGILVILIIIQLFLTFWVDEYVGNRLKKAVRESTKSTYTINFDDLNLNVFSGSASINNLRIDADTIAFAARTTPSRKQPKSLFQGTIGNLYISGIDVYSAMMGKELSVGSINITRPRITRFQNPRQLPADSSSNFATVDSSIYAAISKQYDALAIGEFTISDGMVTSMQSSDTLSSINNLNLTLQNIRVDSTSAQSGRIFVTDDIALSVGPFSKKMADSLNTIKFNKLELSSADQVISVDSFRLDPRYPKFEYSRRNGQKIDRIELEIPNIKLESVDFSSFIDSVWFHADYMQIDSARFEDFLNKSRRPGPIKPKEMPFIAFRDMDQPVKIDSIRINNANISYSEYLSKAPRQGTITFEQLNAIFHKVSNYPQDIADGITMELDAQTRVYGQGLLEAHFDFPMDTQNGFHKIKGRLNNMSITTFNRMAKYIAFVRIDEGTVNSLDFNMTLNNDRSNGEVIMNYENLKISMLDPETMKQRGVKENIITFVANNFVVKKSNTPEGGMRVGRIQFERADHKSVFNYWWKSLQSGIKNSVK